MSHARRNGLIDLLEEEDNPAWLTTFADMMTLLLVFFVLMYAMYYLETEKFKAAVAEVEVQSREDGQSVSLLDYIEKRMGGDPIKLEDAIGLHTSKDDVHAQLETLIASANLGDSVIAVEDGQRIIVRVAGELLFDSGSATLRNGAGKALEGLAVTFFEYPDFKVSIGGHTDDQPISTARFASNWELSALRATAALRYFVSRGLPAAQFSATGYGDQLPLADNDSPAGRAANRRVEFVLEKATR